MKPINSRDLFSILACGVFFFFLFWAIIAWLSPFWAAFWIIVIFVANTFKYDPFANRG